MKKLFLMLTLILGAQNTYPLEQSRTRTIDDKPTITHRRVDDLRYPFAGSHAPKSSRKTVFDLLAPSWVASEQEIKSKIEAEIRDRWNQVEEIISRAKLNNDDAHDIREATEDFLRLNAGCLEAGHKGEADINGCRQAFKAHINDLNNAIHNQSH